MTKLDELKAARDTAFAARDVAWMEFCHSRDIAFTEYLTVCDVAGYAHSDYLDEQYEIKLKEKKVTND